MGYMLKDVFSGLLNKPGDSLSAKVTKSGRGVVKLRLDDGKVKYSEVHYPNRVVKQISIPKKDA